MKFASAKRELRRSGASAASVGASFFCMFVNVWVSADEELRSVCRSTYECSFAICFLFMFFKYSKLKI